MRYLRALSMWATNSDSVVCLVYAISFRAFQKAGGIKDMKDVARALRTVKDKAATFISRGDRSGTHLAELMLWNKDVGIDIEKERGSWYTSIGQGMGAALHMAVASNAYVLSDRGSWIDLKNKGDLQILVEGDRRLFNQYGVILMNPAKHPNVKREFGQSSRLTLVLMPNQSRCYSLVTEECFIAQSPLSQTAV